MDSVVSSPSPREQLLQQLSASLPAEPELVLVTDLDGTLLGGEDPWRRRFYRWLRTERHRVLHVFSTGRDLASVAQVLQQEQELGLGAPHLVIGDVGCTVACGESLAPLPLAVDPIDARWRGLPERLIPLLAAIPGVAPQPVSAQRRLAYRIDPAALDASRLAAIEAHGVDCLVSDNRYLDVLPAGVNKGSTLLALLAWLELEHAVVVTAGDSLNDLAMFETGLKGVMVGNAEADLVAQLPRLSSTYRAQAHGCEGIVEGLRHFGFDHLLAASFSAP
ncbi:MAG: HAD hydrolase family protein [Cyanobacteria bacterium REEB498]|nr:HAD hydrolase family protein [Cyanobacteria bacterium REEB498]